MVASTITYMLHTLFAALWAGSMIFVGGVVLPAAERHGMGITAVRTLLSRFLWITRASVLLLLLTGGHLAGTLYTTGTLTGTGPGHLVLAMLVLWLVLAIVIEVGTARAQRDLKGVDAKEALISAKPFYVAGTLCAIGLLLIAGLLGANRLFGVF